MKIKNIKHTVALLAALSLINPAYGDSYNQSTERIGSMLDGRVGIDQADFDLQWQDNDTKPFNDDGTEEDSAVEYRAHFRVWAKITDNLTAKIRVSTRQDDGSLLEQGGWVQVDSSRDLSIAIDQAFLEYSTDNMMLTAGQFNVTEKQVSDRHALKMSDRHHILGAAVQTTMNDADEAGISVSAINLLAGYLNPSEPSNIFSQENFSDKAPNYIELSIKGKIAQAISTELGVVGYKEDKNKDKDGKTIADLAGDEDPLSDVIDRREGSLYVKANVSVDLSDFISSNQDIKLSVNAGILYNTSERDRNVRNASGALVSGKTDEVDKLAAYKVSVDGEYNSSFGAFTGSVGYGKLNRHDPLATLYQNRQNGMTFSGQGVDANGEADSGTTMINIGYEPICGVKAYGFSNLSENDNHGAGVSVDLLNIFSEKAKRSRCEGKATFDSFTK